MLGTPEQELECGTEAQEIHSLRLEFALNYTESCYNVDDMFSQIPANETRTCNPVDPFCGNDEWSASAGLVDYDSSANYSQVTFLLIDQLTERPMNGTVWPNDDVILQVFEGENCEEVSPERPFYQYGNCDSRDYVPDDGCATLPYGIRSLQVLRTPEENKSESCLVAAERGAGANGYSICISWVVMVAFGASMLLSLN